MKKIISLLISLLLLGLLVACSATSAATGAQATNASGGVGGAPNGTPGPGGFQMSALNRLLFGIFALEDTTQAVTAEQARALLPLWQAVQVLSQSDTAAEAEMAALEQQIQDTLTAEQLSTLSAMELTPEDMQSLMADLGLSFGNSRGGTQPAPNGTPGPGGTFGGGGLSGGGGPGDGGGFPGGGGFNPQNLSPEQQATLQARIAGRQAQGVPLPLLNALIELLESKAL